MSEPKFWRMEAERHARSDQAATANHKHGDIWAYIDGIAVALGKAEERIAVLEDRLHDHEFAVPHAESEA